MSTCDLAIEILHATSDGDDLAPEHLKLIELAVNGDLNAYGEQEFARLVDNVRGGYQRPWFHDLEHLTIHHSGYVKWKGVIVEHYTMSLAYSERGRREAEEIARRCRALEAAGMPVNMGSVVWTWEER